MQAMPDDDEDRPEIYLMCLAADRDAARPVRDWLFAAGFEVRLPPTTDEAYAALHTRRLESADAFVVFWGSADESWLEPLLTESEARERPPQGEADSVKGHLSRRPANAGETGLPDASGDARPRLLADARVGGAATAAGRAQARRARERRVSVAIDTRLTAPFLGLRYFDEEHSHLFFGRDVQINDILEKLRRSQARHGDGQLRERQVVARARGRDPSASRPGSSTKRARAGASPRCDPAAARSPVSPASWRRRWRRKGSKSPFGAARSGSSRRWRSVDWRPRRTC